MNKKSDSHHPDLIFSDIYTTGIEVVYLLLYGKNNNFQLPSKILFPKVKREIKKLLSSRGKLLLTYKYYTGELSYYEYIIDNSKFLIRLEDTSILKDDVALHICGFDKINFDKFIDETVKKHIIENNYNKDTFFGILYQTNKEFSVRQLKLNDDKLDNLDLSLNYGKEFLNKHNSILTKMKNNHGGLFVFHGITGSGKSTYIKYLAKILGGERQFIFIPTSYLDTLVSPNLIPVLLDNKNSIIVLEDAERAVISREYTGGNESLVSTLLNISDGILGSMLNLSIIATFNTKKEKIDDALLRKGRLQYEHEFQPLSIQDSQILLDKSGKNFVAKSPMTLAEIYNIDIDTGDIQEEKPKNIGFAT